MLRSLFGDCSPAPCQKQMYRKTLNTGEWLSVCLGLLRSSGFLEPLPTLESLLSYWGARSDFYFNEFLRPRKYWAVPHRVHTAVV